ncbi:MAG: hypothetical protein ABI790_07390 [Betaproteobacteria bacterium]
MAGQITDESDKFVMLVKEVKVTIDDKTNSSIGAPHQAKAARKPRQCWCLSIWGAMPSG